MHFNFAKRWLVEVGIVVRGGILFLRCFANEAPKTRLHQNPHSTSLALGSAKIFLSCAKDDLK